MVVIRFSNTVDIARTPADVFAYLADLEHTPEWNWAITNSQKLDPGPVTVGTRFRQTRSVPRPGVEVLEVTRLDADRRIEVAGDLASLTARLSYVLSEGPRGTRLTNVVELEPPGRLALLGSLFTGRVQASVAENLGVLRMVLEGKAANRGPEHRMYGGRGS
jgi:uncharacterized protein YndB with AHSA1/START domain